MSVVNILVGLYYCSYHLRPCLTTKFNRLYIYKLATFAILMNTYAYNSLRKYSL